MKRFVLWAVVPALIVLAIAYFVVPLHLRYAPAIRVTLNDEASGGSVDLPAVDGYVSGEDGTARESAEISFQTHEGYKIISTAKGRFAVIAHYDINRNGVLTSTDRTLPVWNQLPDKSKWTKLDNHFVAYAYLTGTQTGY